MKNINVQIDDDRYADLKFIQDYYSKKSGTKVSLAGTVRMLFYESANLIRNTGETYPGRDWTLSNQEEEIHRSHEKKLKGGQYAKR